jgi:hypothetical protein
VEHKPRDEIENENHQLEACHPGIMDCVEMFFAHRNKLRVHPVNEASGKKQHQAPVEQQARVD